MTSLAAFFLAVGFATASLLAMPNVAVADEDDDLQRQIDTQKSGVTDLEHLDTRHAAASEIQRLSDWLGAAWDLRNKHEPDAAREVLDRCLAQAELIRQFIAAATTKADVDAGEAHLKKTRAEIAQKKQALKEAEVKKKTLEPMVGK